MKTGIELIAQERAEQIEKHRISIQSDIDFNCFNQLIDAAISLLLIEPTMKDIPTGWDKEIWQKMINKSYKERLIISGALIAADLDRLQMLEINESNNKSI